MKKYYLLLIIKFLTILQIISSKINIQDQTFITQIDEKSSILQENYRNLQDAVTESKPNTILKETKQQQLKSDPVQFDYLETNDSSQYLLQQEFFQITTNNINQNVILTYTQKNSNYESKTALVTEEIQEPQNPEDQQEKNLITTDIDIYTSTNAIYPNSCSSKSTNTYLSLWTNKENGILYGQIMDGDTNQIIQSLTIQDTPGFMNHDSSCEFFGDDSIIIIWVESEIQLNNTAPIGNIYFQLIDTDFNQNNSVKVNDESTFNRGGCTVAKVAILENSRFVIVFHQYLTVRVRIYDNIFHKRYEQNGDVWVNSTKINQGIQPCVASTSNGYIIGYISNGNILHSAYDMTEDRPLFEEGKDSGLVQEKASLNNQGVQVITFTEEQYMFVWSGTRTDGEYENSTTSSIQVKFYKTYNELDSTDTVLAFNNSFNYYSPQVTSMRGAYRRFMLAYIKENTTDNSKIIEGQLVQYLIFNCEDTCDVCFSGEEGYYCGKCYLDRDPTTDCVKCLPAFIEINGKCQCPLGFQNDGNSGCIPCPEKMEGDGEGGCICLIGLEITEQGSCRPSFQFSDTNASYLDGYGETTSKRIQTPPAEADKKQILIVVLCFSVLFIFCCVYSEYLNIQRRKKFRKSKRIRNKNMKKATPKEVFIVKPVKPNDIPQTDPKFPLPPQPEPQPQNNVTQNQSDTFKNITIDPVVPIIPQNQVIVQPQAQYQDSSFQVDTNELEPLNNQSSYEQTNIIIQPPVASKKNMDYNFQAFEISIQQNTETQTEKPLPNKNKFIIDDLDNYGAQNEQQLPQQVPKQQNRQVIDDLDNFGKQNQQEEIQVTQEDKFQITEIQNLQQTQIIEEKQQFSQKNNNFFLQQAQQNNLDTEKQKLNNASQSSSASGEFEWEEY